MAAHTEQEETYLVCLTDSEQEIILTDKTGAILEVDALAYPEDTHLVVDPYTTFEEPDSTMPELIAEAQAMLPRPLGEILMARARTMKATWLLRLVLLDFDGRHHCRTKTVEETLQQLIWQVADMKVQRLGLDRFELLEPFISAYRVLACLCNQIKNIEAAGGSPPRTLIFSMKQPGARRHYQLALENLPSH